MNESQVKRPKIGIALSGGAGRAVGHIAILNTFKEHNIPVDIVVGCSSGALVAVAYGAGTTEYLKGIFSHTMTGRKAWSLWTFWGARGGIFHMHKGDYIFKELTKGLNFEDLPIKIGVTAADIETGELATITSGDIIQGIKASIAIPGLFEPVVINNRILLEGGLVNIVPTIPVKQLGADIVIGVDVAKAPFFYQKRMPLFRLIRAVRRWLGVDLVRYSIINPISSLVINQMEKQLGIKKKRVPNAFRIFTWAIDHSFNIEEEWNEEKRACDLMITPPVKHTGRIGTEQSQFIYDECKKSAEAAIPQIKELIANYEKVHAPERVTQ